MEHPAEIIITDEAALTPTGPRPTVDLLVRLDRSNLDGTDADAYEALGATWGTAGDDYPPEHFALLVVPRDVLDDVSEIFEADDSVIAYCEWSERDLPGFADVMWEGLR